MVALCAPILSFIFQKLNQSFPPEEEDEEEGAWKPVPALALYDYRKDRPEDLEFVKGNVIMVLSKPFPGWWEGEIIEGRWVGSKGLFPENYVQIVTDKEKKDCLRLPETRFPELPSTTNTRPRRIPGVGPVVAETG